MNLRAKKKKASTGTKKAKVIPPSRDADDGEVCTTVLRLRLCV